MIGHFLFYYQNKYILVCDKIELLIYEGVADMLKELRYCADRLEPCNIYDKNDMIKIYFHQVQSKACFILKEFSKGADSFCVVESGLPDDETINYVVKFHKSRLEDIAFVQYCISKDGRIGGCALYNIPIVEYWAALECDISPQVYVSAESKAYYREIFEHIYRICDEKKITMFCLKKCRLRIKCKACKAMLLRIF